MEIQWPALDVLSIDGVLLDRRAMSPSDVENIFLNKGRASLAEEEACRVLEGRSLD